MRGGGRGRRRGGGRRRGMNWNRNRNRRRKMGGLRGGIIRSAVQRMRCSRGRGALG